MFLFHFFIISFNLCALRMAVIILFYLLIFQTKTFIENTERFMPLFSVSLLFSSAHKINIVLKRNKYTWAAAELAHIAAHHNGILKEERVIFAAADVVVIGFKRKRTNERASKHGASKNNHDHDVIHCSSELNYPFATNGQRKRNETNEWMETERIC